MRLFPRTAISRAAASDRETPNIIAPAPWILFGALGCGLVLDTVYRIGILAKTSTPLRNSIAMLLIAAGGWLVFRVVVEFRRVDTPFLPWLPTSSLAVRGVYEWTRNPMYQGFLSLAIGIGIALRSDWTLLMLLVAALVIHYGVVLREEHYLARRFGESYRAYLNAVPRYGLPGISRLRGKKAHA